MIVYKLLNYQKLKPLWRSLFIVKISACIVALLDCLQAIKSLSFQIALKIFPQIITLLDYAQVIESSSSWVAKEKLWYIEVSNLFAIRSLL